MTDISRRDAAVPSPVSLSSRDGLLVCRCDTCGLLLRQQDTFDRDIALGTFLSSHPQSPWAVHRQVLPDGWAPVTDPAVAA